MQSLSPYAFRLTSYLKEEITKRPQGALAKQFLFQEEELHDGPEDMADPIGDQAHSPCPGIVHRYPDRALLMVAKNCAAYCRYCFRKEVVGRTKPITRAEKEEALEYLRQHDEIKEVILTGGDPLILSNSKLNDWFHEILAIPHLRLIRIHTRAPLVDPERVDDELAELLSKLSCGDQSFYMVIHCNHAEELTPPVREAIRRLQQKGIALLTQSVLLKGVNDSTEALEGLFRELLYLGVKPYYLHHLDRAPGTNHFRVSIEKGQQLVNSLRGKLSGLAQPHYVIDIPGGFGKVPVTADFVKKVGEGHYEITDPKGKTHIYKDQ